MKNLIIALFLTLPVWAQNNFAVDFNSSQGDLLRVAVANYRASDEVGFVSLWVSLDAFSTLNSLWGSSQESTTLRYVAGRYYNNSAGNYFLALLQTNNDALSAIGPSGALSTATAYHFVFGSDGSATLIWINGVAIANTAWAGTDAGDWFADTPTGRDNFTVGALRATTTLSPTDGKVDEVSVHNVTPTQALVDAIYNGGTPRDVRNIGSSGVVNYWRFEEGTGQYAFDSVGSDTLVFGDDATVEADDPAWIAAGLGWDAGKTDPGFPRFPNRPKFPTK